MLRMGNHSDQSKYCCWNMPVVETCQARHFQSDMKTSSTISDNRDCRKGFQMFCKSRQRQWKAVTNFNCYNKKGRVWEQLQCRHLFREVDLWPHPQYPAHTARRHCKQTANFAVFTSGCRQVLHLVALPGTTNNILHFQLYLGTTDLKFLPPSSLSLSLSLSPSLSLSQIILW